VVEIRQRRPDDLDGCVAALTQVHGSGGGYPTRWPADPHAWLDPADAARTWVAADGPAIVGHVMVRVGPDGTAEVSRLYVAPSAQGRGLATALLTAARAYAAGRGLALTLQVTTGQDAAIALYERTGWRRTGTVFGWTTPAGDVYLHQYTT
jgi:ribosomal protein S18 acetylase RimI-like enzyme